MTTIDANCGSRFRSSVNRQRFESGRRLVSVHPSWTMFLCVVAVWGLALGTVTGQVPKTDTPPAANNPPANNPPAGDPATGGQSISSATGESGSLNNTGPEREKAIEFLINEIENLTPGKFAEGTNQRETVSEAVKAFADQDLVKTRELLEKFGSENPNASPVGLMMAALMYAAGNPTEGSRLLEDAAVLNADLPTIYNALARLALAQRRMTDALVLLEKTDELIQQGTWNDVQKKFFVAAYRDATADLMLQRRDYGKAREILNQLQADVPDSPRVLMRLAEVDFFQQKLEDCLATLEKFRRVEPAARVPEFMLASFFAQNGDLTSAENWVEKAFAKYPGDPNVIAEYADYMVSRERFDKANAALERVPAADAEKLPGIRLLSGKISFAQGDYLAAEAVFEKLHDMLPDNFEITNLWAMALAESGQADKVALALQVAQQNVQAQPQNPVAVAILGWVYLKQSNFEQAQVWLARAAQARNVTPEVGYFFARYLQIRGEKQQALDIITGALKHQGLFLYRSKARLLEKELGGGEKLSPPK